jgi:voltage-gated potassium channel
VFITKQKKKLSEKQHKIYDLVISSFAVIAAVLVLIDLSEGLNVWQSRLDTVILIVFTVDYVVRFVNARDKWKFVRTNICDLIAIIPFYTIFRLFRAVSLTKTTRLAKLLRFFKLPRLFAFLYRPLKKAHKFFNTNGFKYVVFVTAIMIIIGGVLIHFAEGMSYGDGIWWAFVTATTVGYGDISPTTFYGRMIAMVLMLLGIGLIGTVTSTLTSYFLNVGTKSVKDETIENIKTRLDDFDQLSQADVDDICEILKSLKKKEKH